MKKTLCISLVCFAASVLSAQGAAKVLTSVPADRKEQVLQALWRGLGTCAVGRATSLRDALAADDFGTAVKLTADHFRARPPLTGFGGRPGTFDRETADRACTGDVTVVNIPWRFPDGRIDWHFNPTDRRGPANAEWHLQLNRMYFWPHMAEAYAATGDERYARAFRGQMRSWVEGTMPRSDGNLFGKTAWRTIETGIRLMRIWPLAFERFRKSPSLSDEDLCLMLGSMAEQAHHLLAHPTTQNWLLMEMCGVYTFAALFPEFGEAEMMRREAARVLVRELGKQILPDGFQFELSPDYQSVSWSCFAGTYDLARRCKRLDELPPEYARILERMADSQLALATPGFVQPRSNDCFTIPTDRFMRLAAEFFPERTDFRWALTHRAEGEPPKGETASRILPWAGFAALRSGWDADASYLFFDFGPLSMGHCHADKLNVNLWKGDEELIFDDGGGQYESSSLRGYGVSAFDHNTMLVDGLGQTRKGPGKVDAAIDAGFSTTKDCDRISGVYDQEFGGRGRIATHRRDICFDKAADVFTLTDTATATDGKEHVYTLLFQLDTTNVTVAADGRSLHADYGRGRKWALDMEFGNAAEVSAVSGRMKPSPAGWYVGRNDASNHVATTVFVRSPRVRDHVFTTRLKPVRADGFACRFCYMAGGDGETDLERFR